MAEALEKVDEISAFRLGRVKVDRVPPNRLATLTRVGLGSKVPILERTPEPKRTALLTSVVRWTSTWSAGCGRWTRPGS
ncbi:hypothetical protein [Nonomuraea roseola]|uniref:Uncharacterized protein n=1 Tax=Nonomuraea roseola TaxID=46179 RepID=A0ABV5QAL7_9ACTN